jgi:hypothetical protein
MSQEASGLGRAVRKPRPVSLGRALTRSGTGWTYNKEERIAVGTAYFPNAQDIKGHTNANEELRGDFSALSNMGYSMVLGGDFNAHTGSNGDKTPTDKAGIRVLSSIEDAGMINTIPDKCSGGPTRVQVHKDDTQESTLD